MALLWLFRAGSLHSALALSGTLGLGPPHRLPGRRPGQLSSAQVQVSPAIRGAAHFGGKPTWSRVRVARMSAGVNVTGVPRLPRPPPMLFIMRTVRLGTTRRRGSVAAVPGQPPAPRACRRRPPMARLVLRARVRMPAAPRAGPLAAPARATAQRASWWQAAAC